MHAGPVRGSLTRPTTGARVVVIVATHAVPGLALAAVVLFALASCGYVLAAGLERRQLAWCSKPFAMPLLALAYVAASVAPNP